MFPTNPFPLLTSTIQVFQSSNSFLDHQKHDHHWINNHNPYDLVEAQGSLEHYNEYNHLFWSEIKKEKPSKKDHHSKIHTAKGPRDRRVRLSIEVAKKFFFLQDLLEVDKASETLDWLFNKSKISIDDLIKRKKETSSSTVITDQSEVIFLETDEQDKGRNKKCGERKRKKITQKYKSGFNQLRADARARARARTKEKLNIKMLDVDCCSSDLTLQSSFWSSIESQNDYNDKISTVYSYENNLVVSNDSSSKFAGLPKFADHHQQRGDRATI